MPQVRVTGAFGIIDTMSTEPWRALGDPQGGFFDEPDFLPPGSLVRWHREEAAIRAEEQQREAERAERAEIRQELAMWEARQHAVARGLAWNPAKPFEHMPNVYARADAMFAVQDAQQRDADRRALREHGLEHLLGDLPVPPVASPGDAAPPTSRSRALAPTSGAARANPVGTRIREALTRWAHRSTGPSCGCASCDPHALHRAHAEAGLPPREITRFTYMYDEVTP